MSTVNPDERPNPSPVGQVAGRVAALEEQLGVLNNSLTAAFDAQDDEIADIYELLTMLTILIGALRDSVMALTADPHNPMSSAAEARKILEDANANAEGDGVVPDAEGDLS